MAMAFEGSRCIATGELPDVALKSKDIIDGGGGAAVLIFDDRTGERIDIDFRGTAEDVLQRLTRVEAPRRAGRPKLGVVAREVTLLPRHWEWLNSQPGGASVALRKLVEHARRANATKDQIRQAQEAAYRFMSAMAGDAPGFEEAARALFAGNREHFEQHAKLWPEDVRYHASRLAAAVFQPEEGQA